MKAENYIQIQEYLKIIRKRIILILLIVISTTLVTAFISYKVIKPVYEAKCSVIIGKGTSANITESEVTMYQSLVKTYCQIAKSRLVAESAAKNLGLENSADELMLNIDVSTENGTQIIDISYKSENPKDAMLKVNALTVAFVEQSQTLLASGTIKLIDSALVPKTPISPNKNLNIAVGFLLGLMGSLIIIFIVEYLDNTIKNEEDIEKIFGFKTLGSIPKHAKISNIIVESEPKSYIAEAFKTFRTNLLFMLENRGIKSVLICSSSVKEGKTIISCNIANTIAQTGKRVLLIDCDLRRPSIHINFNVPNQLGLVDILIDGKNIFDAKIEVQDNLDILTAGKYAFNPSEILSSKNMQLFIKEMENSYDFVIIDTPPVIQFTDALTLVSDKIGVIFVVSSEETKLEMSKKSVELLLKVNANILGVAINKINTRQNMNYRNDYLRDSNKDKIKFNRSVNKNKTKKSTETNVASI